MYKILSQYNCKTTVPVHPGISALFNSMKRFDIFLETIEYDNGCSLRFVCPSSFFNETHTLPLAKHYLTQYIWLRKNVIKTKFNFIYIYI